MRVELRGFVDKVVGKLGFRREMGVEMSHSWEW